ncbi:MAG: TIGR03936 family radical SAM-associated protein [Candidatus Omnitrophica bacterium]|nr:TIGR03936 family radical SAM-associated protein [Candidatus Omnitrophota bacterium]MBU1869631.1 TIGR03936 family radical SAM-associated protein [Candidatus Omnitrophota bacterium]
MYRIDWEFTKQGQMKYISHLDLMRLFQRALRRAEIPVKITEGFNPHPKLSLKRALKLGIESESEEGTIVLAERIGLDKFKEQLQKQLPEGIVIKNVKGNIN